VEVRDNGTHLGRIKPERRKVERAPDAGYKVSTSRKEPKCPKAT
jgi:hypothetical protein